MTSSPAATHYLLGGIVIVVGILQLWVALRTHRATLKEVKRRSTSDSMLGRLLGRFRVLRARPSRILIEFTMFAAGIVVLSVGVGILLWGVDRVSELVLPPIWECPTVTELVPEMRSCARWAYEHTSGTCVVPEEFGVLVEDRTQAYREYCAYLFALYGSL